MRYVGQNMEISFEHPPLVEVAAELRWGLPGLSPQAPAGVSFPVAGLPSTGHEEFFTRFSREIAAHGFTMVERLLPPGFPALPFQPVYRFRTAAQESGTRLYQLGTNTFSAHATPPYRSWHEFEPSDTAE
jgi:uncharacterized protein (TIGR04255 family)